MPSSTVAPIAVAIVHGVSIDDPEFHHAPMAAIRGAFRGAFRTAPPADAQGLRFVPINWGAAFQARQDELLELLSGGREPDYAALAERTKRIYAGDTSDILGLGRELVDRPLWDRKASPEQLNYLALRWLLVHFVGDALAYPSGATHHDSYLQVHDIVADALHAVAVELPEAPLAVVAHSLGSVVMSDFFYDRQNLGDDASAGTAIERGDTLTAMFTLGSPLAMWMLRAAASQGMDRPIRVPAPRAAKQGARGGWWNFFDPDDVIASPLAGISPAYAQVITEDVSVHVGPRGLGMTPLCHPLYWTDPAVTGRIGRELAKIWVAQNPAAGAELNGA